MKAKFAVVLFLLASTVGCKKEDDKKTVQRSYTETGQTGTLALSFSNDTPSSVFELLKPSYFGIKIVAVELVDEDGNYRAVWVNPACNDSKKQYGVEVEMTPEEKAAAEAAIKEREGLGENSVVDAGRYKSVFYDYYDAQDCDDTAIDTFVDLARTSDEVNEEINSQGLPVPPGTYTQVSLRLCSTTAEESYKGQKFQAQGMAQAEEVLGAGCGVTSAPEASLTVAGGETATVSLSYDLTKFVEKTTYTVGTEPDPDKNGNCYIDSGTNTYYCSKVGADTIVPSIVVE